MLFKFDVCDYYDASISQFEFSFSIDFRRFFMQLFIFSDSYERFAFSLTLKPYLKLTVEDVSKKRKVTILKRFRQVDELLLYSKEKMPFVSISAFSIITFSELFFLLFISKFLQNLFTQIKSYNSELSFKVSSPTLNRQKKTF